MKNLIIALTLFVSLLIFGSFVVTRSIEAQTADLLPVLLELPAPPPPNPLVPVSNREHPEDFYNKEKPPADNAPIEDLLDYWKVQNDRYNRLGYNIELSGRSLDRVLAEIEKDPEKATEFLNVLPENPETADVIKLIYDQMSSDDGEENESYYQRNQLKNWLKYHSSYFSDELFSIAMTVGDTSVGYVSNQDELLALARVDWNKAKPILDRLYNDSGKPVSQTLARWAFYRHALDTDSFGDIERYRDELKADVENKKASDGLRDLAFDALVKEKDWSGRDDWYFSLLEDETLSDLRVGGSSYTGLTTILLYSPPEKYADKMIELVKSSNLTVRNAAVRNLGTLLDDKNPEVIKALLPWLEDEKWATEISAERRKLVAALANFEIPESVPGLIALLDEKETREVPDYSSYRNSNSISVPPPPPPPPPNSANLSSNFAVVRPNINTKIVEYYPFRSAAISALAKQKDVRAVPALRRILSQVEQYERTNVIRAIFLSNGFSIPEQIAALESAAQTVKEEMETEVATRKAKLEEKETIDDVVDEDIEPPRISTIGVANGTGYSANTYYSEDKPLPPITAAEIKTILGQQIIANPEPSPQLLTAVVQRINVLDRQNPPLANALRRIMLGWSGTAVNLVLLNDLKMGKSDINAVVKLLSIRKELREKQLNDIYAIRSGGTSVALGISACLLETQGDFNAILVSENAEAKAAMFGCARLIRAELPVSIVAQNLNSPNKLLALSAERYLESEDSQQARQIILSKYPNEAKILGATTFFGDGSDMIDGGILQTLFQSVDSIPPFEQYYYFYGDDENIIATEKKLQKEVKATPELLGVYAYDDNFVRIYQDRIMFSYSEDESRYRERYLTPAEFDNLKNYLINNRVDELKPFLKPCEEECEEKELLMLGRQGGRRVYFKGYEKDGFFAGLDKLFEEMRKPPAKLRYELEKSVPGLEILFADENFQAQTVWKNGNDLRILISDTKLRERIDEDLSKQEGQVKYDENTDYEQVTRTNRERRSARAFDHFSWRKMSGEKIGEMIAPPSNFGFPPPRDSFRVRPSTEQWKARTANLEIRADDTGLYKITGSKLTKIRDGYYDKPVVTPDGRWAVAVKLDMEDGFKLVRVNLTNNQEFQIEMDGYARFEPVAVLSSGKKVLFRLIPYEEYYDEEGDETSESDYINPSEGQIYALDVQSGTIEKTKGEIRPFAGQTIRPLQQASAPDEFWAAIPEGKATKIGTYNIKTLAFKPLMTIPEISFGSMNMWVDETEGKVYFVYKGQLLALKLK